MSDNEFINSHSLHANVFSYMGAALSRNPDDADVFIVGLPYNPALT